MSGSAEATMLTVLPAADQGYSISELVSIVNICSIYCHQSKQISKELTQWLREDNAIYKNRLPSEVNQLRGFIMASLVKFPANEEMYQAVKYELTFATHAYNIGAAALCARNFKQKAKELLPLLIPYLNLSFMDETIDLNTPELTYPVDRPTKARYEIIETLASYGAAAYPAVSTLDKIIAVKKTGEYNNDAQLYLKATNAAIAITNATPPCCREHKTESPVSSTLTIIDKNKRISIAGKTHLLDQEGNAFTFNKLYSKPFVLAFFYTQCSNTLKCASTANRMGKLADELATMNMGDKTGVYGMTYDPDFDTPPILKKFGKMYRVNFSNTVKFLKVSDNSFDAFRQQLQLRVNYGAGTVNQHGIQIFIFDKKGRIAYVSDNEMWMTTQVKDCLVSLSKE